MSLNTKSLKKQNHELSNIDKQLKVLHDGVANQNLDSFSTKLTPRWRHRSFQKTQEQH